MRFLLDTNIISELVKPVPDPNVVARFDQHRWASAITTTTLAEIVFGLERRPHPRHGELTDTLADLAILPFDEAAARWTGRERARLERVGRVVPFADAQIAAIAATRELTLVTRNVDDFAAFPITLANWFE